MGVRVSRPPPMQPIRTLVPLIQEGKGLYFCMGNVIWLEFYPLYKMIDVLFRLRYPPEKIYATVTRKLRLSAKSATLSPISGKVFARNLQKQADNTLRNVVISFV